MKDFNDFYSEYKKEVEKATDGLIKADKSEFLKFVLAYQILRTNEENELRKELRKTDSKKSD